MVAHPSKALEYFSVVMGGEEYSRTSSRSLEKKRTIIPSFMSEILSRFAAALPDVADSYSAIAAIASSKLDGVVIRAEPQLPALRPTT